MRKIKAMSSSLQDLKDKWQEVKAKQPEIEAAASAQETNFTKKKKLQPKMVVSGAKQATSEQLKELMAFAGRNKPAAAKGRGQAPSKQPLPQEDSDLKKQEKTQKSEVRQEKKKTKPVPGQEKGKKLTSLADLKKIEVKKTGPVKPDKPETENKSRRVRERGEKETSEIFRNVPAKLELAENLPVSERADDIREAIKNNQIVIVSGETGSGKTTQLPKICLQLGRGQKGLIGHTQPRRIAAVSIAKRIAEETGTKVGEVAGYQIRFKDEMEAGASIKLMTDGILLAETQTDPLLKKYDTIIIDEAHERSLNIDFLLGYLRQILPKRPDLKVIITSATIDSERFAKHFDQVNGGKPVPVINVSGRLYPVQIRYRPVIEEDENDDRTLMEAIADACDELLHSGPGDILVFLPGEREIREAADVLGRNPKPGLEILPLFSRLSIEEQDRIFRPSGARRIVLATNIAETSITVPGIRYVVDSGLGRVKRYSYRNKVEQLQVEPISQAAAQQRAGRCGRVSNGICIRLYDEQDFEKRPKYTDPEILRSSLATVILRMKSLHLSDVREFPFVEPPMPKAITDGYDLLIELNAVTAREGELTKVGRELAKLPVDAKVARMLQAAQDNQALSEVLIIASAISVQDPRERPLDKQTQADQAHKKFSDDKSDFLSYLKIWNYAQDAIANKKSNRLLERQFQTNFLSARRLREWRDVHRQLKEMVTELGWRLNTAPATYEQLHKALLSGLLGSIGNRIVEPDWRSPPFAGARGIKFWPWPGSALAKKAGKWIMASEIVETSRLYARTIANIEPEWLEKVGAHLIKKSWSDSHWEKNAGNVIAFEKGTLYGLPVYGQRRVNFAPKDAKLAREIFIREALVNEDFDSQAPFWQHNKSLIKDIRDMEHKSRRPDVLVDDEQIFAFYDSRLGAEVCSVSTLEKWRKENEAKEPKLLFLSKKDLMRHDASGITIEYFPKKIEAAGIPMAVSYNFDPGSPRDGVTLTVPLYALNQISEEQMEWLVPGMVKEKTAALLKGLPQRLRRHFVPIPDWAKSFAQAHETPEGGLLEAISREAAEQFRIEINKTDFKVENLPPHLRMNYKVVDEHGRQVGMDRSLPKLRSEFSQQAKDYFQQVASMDSRVAEDLQEEIVDWTFGELPEVMEIRRKGVSLIGHPAIADRGDYCSIEVFDEPEEAKEVHKKGIRKLIRFQLKEQIKYLDKSLKSLQSAQIVGSSLPFAKQAFESIENLKSQVINAAIEQSCLLGKLPINQQEFGVICQESKGKLNLIAMEISRLIEQIVNQAAGVNQKLNAFKNIKELNENINSQLKEMFFKNFIENKSINILRNYPRYLKAVEVRLEKYRKDPSKDAEKAEEINKLTIKLNREKAARRGVEDPRLDEFENLLQELRVSLFAQELRTPMPVSVKRLNKVWDSLIGSSRGF